MVVLKKDIDGFKYHRLRRFPARIKLHIPACLPCKLPRLSVYQFYEYDALDIIISPYVHEIWIIVGKIPPTHNRSVVVDVRLAIRVEIDTVSDNQVRFINACVSSALHFLINLQFYALSNFFNPIIDRFIICIGVIYSECIEPGKVHRLVMKTYNA